MVEGRKITLRKAGEKMAVSYGHAKRIRRAIRERGIKGLLHGNRGQPSMRRIGDALREKVLAFSKGVYRGFNDTHFTEKLRECEGMKSKTPKEVLAHVPIAQTIYFRGSERTPRTLFEESNERKYVQDVPSVKKRRFFMFLKSFKEEVNK